MEKVQHWIEELDKGLEYVKNNKVENQAHFQDAGYHKGVIRGIRGDIKSAQRNMLDYINEISKDDIKVILEKIVEIEDVLYKRNE